MEWIKFECEAITPMFLAGADGVTPELRPASIKGALRFWWRALHGNLSIDKLYKREAEIFGGSGDGQGRSKVIIKVSDVAHSHITNSKPVPHKTFKLKSFMPTFTVKIKIIDNIISTENIKNLFIIFSILGGLGRRSRRGFGSFKINFIESQPFVYDEFNKEYLFQIIEKLNPDFKVDNPNNKYPYLKEVIFKPDYKGYSEYSELLLKISNSSHNNNSNYTGFARNKNKLASPIYVSLLEKCNKYTPIISRLNIAPKLSGHDNSQNFIRGILDD